MFEVAIWTVILMGMFSISSPVIRWLNPPLKPPEDEWQKRSKL